MPFYEWINVKTDETDLTTKYDEPPDDSGNWKRVYSFGVGAVAGAAGSPARISGKKKK